jgi:gamma-glutamyltranspeptidase/glutathione hydrolase
MRTLPACLAAALICVTSAAAQEAVQPEKTFALTPTPAVTGSRYMVAAAHPVAAEAGRAVLARGGTAADAMVAVQLALNLVEPQSSGIGGGAFLLYWDAATRSLTSLDGREMAPAAATPDYWIGADGKPVGWWEAVIGGRSVGVPGTLALLEAAHDRWGLLAWSGLVRPVARMADEGFVISPRLEASIAGAAARGLGEFDATRAYFLRDDGTAKRAGDRLVNRAFAKTLRVVAAKKSAALHHGSLAGEIVDAVKTEKNAGILTREDLASYEVIERAPVCAPYRGYDVCGMGPPSSGGLTVGQILMMLEHFDMAAYAPGSGREAQGRHLIAEAEKRAYADRGLYMADADFVRMPGGLLDPAYMTLRAQGISRDTAGGTAEAGNPPWREAELRAPDTDPERPGTSHVVIRDSYGNAASLTTTIETGFGSRVMVGGFLLNNELTDFSRAPSRDGRPVANRVEAGKRPRSSMAPTIVMKDGEPVLLIGSPGGSRIIGYVAQALVAVLDWQMPLDAALALPHVVNRNGETTDVEEGAEGLAAGLAAMGHDVSLRNLNSGLHAIMIDGVRLTGAADPRREGVALGE